MGDVHPNIGTPRGLSARLPFPDTAWGFPAILSVLQRGGQLRGQISPPSPQLVKCTLLEGGVQICGGSAGFMPSKRVH